MKKSALGVIGDQYTRVPPVVTTDLSGQTVIVVGANTGLGFEATKHFASMNPGRLILACRSKEKGSAAAYSAFHVSTAIFRMLTISIKGSERRPDASRSSSKCLTYPASPQSPLSQKTSSKTRAGSISLLPMPQFRQAPTKRLRMVGRNRKSLSDICD